MKEGLLLAAWLGSVAIGFPLLAWTFGSAVLGRFTHLDREERFAASFGLGFAAEALGTFIAFLRNDARLFSVALVLMLVVALLCRLTAPKNSADNGPPLWPLAAVFALAYLHLVGVQALLPAYRGSYWYYDWWMHYDEALVFLGDKPVNTTWVYGYTLASRTPLFNLTTAFVMGIGGDHGFATYQLASVATNSCFVLALYLLVRDLFGRRAAWLGLLVAPLNLWMLHNAWFTWSKMLTAYFLVLALHFYIQSLRQRLTKPARAAEYFFCFSAASVLGFMTHQVSFVYVLPLVLHAGWIARRDRAYRPHLRELLACGLFALAIIGSWYTWLAGTLGWQVVVGGTPATLGNTSVSFRPTAIVNWMGYNLCVSVWPTGIREAVAVGNLVELHRGVTQLYFSLFTGTITISLVVFLLAAAVRQVWRGPPLSARMSELDAAAWGAVGFFLVGGTLGAAFLHSEKTPWGIAHSAAFPSAVVLTALAWGLLSRARPAIRALVCCGMVLEFMLMFWTHRWLLFHNPEILEPGSNQTGPLVQGFLNELLGNADPFFLSGTVLVEAILVVLLLWSTRRVTDAGAKVTE